MSLWTNNYQSDTDPSFKAQGSNLKFGLNAKVFLTKFAFSKELGFNKNQEGIEIEFDVNGSNMKYISILNPEQDEKVYHRGNEVLDKNSPDYKAGQMEAAKNRRGLVTHYLKASGKTDEELQVLYNTATSFSDFFQKAATYITTNVVNTRKPLDVFLQYQSKIKSTADKTYLEVPNTLAYGSFLTASIEPVGEWKEEKSWVDTDEGGSQLSKSGLRYVDGAGNVHRFDRDENYMKGKNSSQQLKEGTTPGNPVPVTPETANPQKAEW